tara:strand:- start:1036 stop:1407 length:372 start_codon:yes stop_codon:yes gene_type:complete
MKLLFENWRKFINESSPVELVKLLRNDEDLKVHFDADDDGAMAAVIDKYKSEYTAEEVIYAAQEAGLIEQGDANYYLEVIAKAGPLSPEEMQKVKDVHGARRPPVSRTDPVIHRSLGGPGGRE